MSGAEAEQAGETSFQQLARGKKRKYVMISGKGGVGKTSLAASLACRLAEGGWLLQGGGGLPFRKVFYITTHGDLSANKAKQHS